MKSIDKKQVIIRCFYYIFRIIPIKKNKIVFCNYLGKGYGCNPKYIAKELLERKRNYEMVWLVTENSSAMPEEIRTVKYESIRSIFELATAGVWVDNQRKLPFNRKRKKQLFIETWHGGGGPMKKIGADNPCNYENEPYEKTSLHMNKITNLMISNSMCCTKIYRSAFLYTREILECGYPRNDIFFNDIPQIKDKVYNYFKIPRNEKLVLYAPTYRNGRTLEHYNIEFGRLTKALNKRFGEKWNILLRLHPTMVKKYKEFTIDERVFNASEYDDIQELLYTSDVLISDYSSVISEFALTKKPIFLFATDVQEYAVEREFYVDYYSLPFSIAKNNEELEENINEFIIDSYQSDVTEYLCSVGMRENGTASATVGDYIEEWMDNY